MSDSPDIIDVTLREAFHLIPHCFGNLDILNVATHLDRMGIDAIEISPPYGLGSPAKLNRGMYQLEKLFNELKNRLDNACLVSMLLPEFSPLTTFDNLIPGEIDILKIAVKPGQIGQYKDYFKKALEVTSQVFVFFMHVHTFEKDQLLVEIEKAIEYGIDTVYLTDTEGLLTPDVISNLMVYVRNHIASSISLGVHCHNHHQEAYENTVSAIGSGASWVDTTISGIGPGAGNCPTENILKLRNRPADNKYYPQSLQELFKIPAIKNLYNVFINSNIRFEHYRS